MVKEVTRPTSYRLCDLDGVEVLNLWHIDHLRRFYAYSTTKKDMYSFFTSSIQ
jgi:hypothetical protein